MSRNTNTNEASWSQGRSEPTGLTPCKGRGCAVCSATERSNSTCPGMAWDLQISCEDDVSDVSSITHIMHDGKTIGLRIRNYVSSSKISAH